MTTRQPGAQQSIATMPVKAACKVLSDEQLADTAYLVELPRGGLARRMFAHWRAGLGGEVRVNMVALLEENHFIRYLVESRIVRWLYGRYHGGVRPDETLEVEQSDYSTWDWSYALGRIPIKIRMPPWPAGSPRPQGTVHVQFDNVYQWAPKEGRQTQCLHQAMARLEQKGARPFLMRGHHEFMIPWSIPQTPAEATQLYLDYEKHYTWTNRTRIRGGSRTSR
jgi:hypothetical protein